MQYKDINTNNGLIRYTFNNGIIGLKQIEYTNKSNTKFLTFTKQMDITLSGIDLQNEDSNEVNFEISGDDIIYPILLKLLGNDKSLIIESDDVRKTNLKYIQFIDCGCSILIKFINNIPNYNIDKKFKIYINMDNYDYKNKIDKNSQNFKNRILELFVDIQELFEEYKVDNSLAYKYQNL